MRGCATCVELEQLLEQTALEYWNVIHKHRANKASEREPAEVTILLARAKDAMDEVQKTYNEHLSLVHSPRVERPDAGQRS
jgi:hypothetical protein